MTRCPGSLPGQRAAPTALVALLMLVSLLPGHDSLAEELLRYRRIYVPENDLPQEIRGLLPLKRDQFERRIAQAKQAAQPGRADAHVERAAYLARVEGTQLVQGSAELQISSASSFPIVMPLGPCNLALRTARWQGAAQGPAVVGQDGAGQLGCLVEGNGTLTWDWTLQGAADPSGAVSFALQLPPAAVSNLRLDLPGDKVLSATGGVASPVAEVPAAPREATEPSGPPRQTWLVEVGGSHSLTLVIQPRVANDAARPLVTVREQSTYSILRSSLDLVATLQVDSFQQVLPELSLRVEPPLQITRIRSGDRTLSWSVAQTGEASSLIAIAPLELARETNFSLEIEATGPWSADAPATLPRIVVQDAVYQEGRATISAAAELGLQARPLRGAWQSAVTPSAAGRGNDQMQFRLHEPGAAIEIEADLAPAGLRETSGTQLVIDGTKISAVMTTELESLGGDYFAVEAQIPRRWIVDAVDVQPAESFSDRTLTSHGPNRQLLRLNLQHALHPSRPLRVVIRAHHRLPSGNQPFEADFYRLATFADVRASRRLVAVRTTEAGARLQWRGDERLIRLDPLQLPEEEMRLFEAVPGSMLFAEEAGSSGLAAELATAAPAFRMEATLEALVAKRQTKQALTLRCIPELSPVGEFVVRLSPRPAGAMDWKLTGDDQRELSVTPLNAGESDAADGADAVYRLALVPPRSAPFEVAAQWSSPTVDFTPLSLAAVPEATAQTGIVTVRTQDGSPLLVESEGVESLPIAESSPEQYSTLRGRYSYRPGRRASLRVLPAGRDSGTAVVRIESLQVQSQFSTDGRGDHAVFLRLINEGAAHLNLRLPAGVLDPRQVDDESGTLLPLSRTSSGVVAVPLPSGQRQVSIQLRYTSARTPLGWRPWGRFEVPLPEPEVLPLARSWTVALGPGLEASGPIGGTVGEFGLLQGPFSGSPTASTALTAVVRLSGGSRTSVRDAELAGWTRYELDLPAGPQATIRVFRSRAMAGLGISLFLLVAIASLRIAARARPWVGLGAIAMLVLAILAPPEWRMLAMGAALGLAAGGVGSWLTLQTSPAPRERSRNSGRRSLVALIAAALIGGGLAQALAAEPATTAGAPRNVPAVDHRVVIATNESQETVGDYVYLSPEFYERLHKLTDAESARLPDWLLISARYHFPRPPRLTGAAPSQDEIDVQIELATFRGGVQVELPLRRDQISLLEGRTRLNGEPAAVTWRADGAALLVTVDAPGRHQLQVACGAPVEKTADAAVLNLAIPVISQSTITAPLALDAQPAFEAPAGGPVAGDPNLRQYSLGPTAHLAARWPLGEPVPAAAQVEVDQLTWWKLKPGSVVVRGKFRFRPIGGALDRALIEVDPRLRIVPGSISPASVSILATTGARNMLTVVPGEKSESELTLTADWLWVGASGAGNLSLPRIAARGDRVGRSWTGISVDPALTIADAGSLSEKSIASEDFLIAWSEPEALPDLAAEDLPASPPRTVTLLPAAPQPTVKTLARWSIDAEQARVTLEANLSQVPAARFRHELDLPPALKVQRVRLTASGAPIPHRWRQRPDGSVVITLLAAPPPEQLLEVEAGVNRARNRPRLPLPNIEVREVHATTAQVRIYRHPQVAVQLQNAAGWDQPQEPGLGQDAPGLGRLVASLSHSSKAAPPQPVVAVTPNRPQATSRLALRVTNDQGQWTAAADIEAQISGGVLDLLRLEVPAEWTGPFAITPAAEYRLVPLPGGATSQLLITPLQAQSDNYRLVVRGPLKNRTNEPVRAPAIAVLDAVTEERIVVLATSVQGKPAVWETRGLQAVPPAGLRLPDGWQSHDNEYYRVVAETFAAAVSSPAAAPSRPTVTLAEIAVAPQDAGRLVGSARFQVDPPSSGELILEMPPQTRLIQASLDGVHCQCRADGLRTWRIAANSLGVPTCLEVIFEGNLPQSAEKTRQVLTAPRLKGLSVHRTIWVLSGLEAGDDLASKPPPRAVSALESEVVKIERLAQNVVRVAEFQSGDLPPAVLAEAFSRWQQQYLAAHSRATALAGESKQTTAEWNARLNNAAQAVTSSNQRMAQAGLKLGIPVESKIADDDALPAQGENRVILMTDGWQGALAVRQTAASEAPDRSWMTAFVVAILLATAWLLLRLVLVRDFLAAQAPAIVAAMGLGWSLLAPWPWLGWVVVGLAIWLAIRLPRLRPSYS